MDRKQMKDTGKDSRKMASSVKSIKLMIAGVIVMISGYILLMGGGVTDPQVFNYDMFDFRRLVAAPVVILAGVVVEIIAIMSVGRERK